MRWKYKRGYINRIDARTDGWKGGKWTVKNTLERIPETKKRSPHQYLYRWFVVWGVSKVETWESRLYPIMWGGKAFKSCVYHKRLNSPIKLKIHVHMVKTGFGLPIRLDMCSAKWFLWYLKISNYIYTIREACCMTRLRENLPIGQWTRCGKIHVITRSSHYHRDIKLKI